MISTREIPRVSTGVEHGQLVPFAELGELTFVVAYASVVAKPETSAPTACGLSCNVASRGSTVIRNGGWKLFLPLSRTLLHRSPRGGPISRDKLIGSFEAGEWEDLINASHTCAQGGGDSFQTPPTEID